MSDYILLKDSYDVYFSTAKVGELSRTVSRVSGFSAQIRYTSYDWTK